MLPQTSDRNRPYALALYRAIAAGRIDTAEAARALEISERGVYRRAENQSVLACHEAVVLANGDAELWAELAGAAFVPAVVNSVPTAKPQVNAVTGAMGFVKQAGAALTEVAADVADGRWDSEETARALVELRELQRQIQGLINELSAPRVASLR